MLGPKTFPDERIYARVACSSLNSCISSLAMKVASGEFEDDIDGIWLDG